MKWFSLGPEAFLLRGVKSGQAAGLANHIRELGVPGVCDVIACYESVGVYGSGVALDDLNVACGSFVGSAVRGKQIEVAVCYEMGLDTSWVCEKLGLSLAELAELHGGSAYDCAAIGFCPGFPYLGPLPPRLAGLARLDSPRVSVPSGSVGVTGSQTGIYPNEMPGGWRLIGRTPHTIVDLADGFFPIQSGDTVRFRRIAEVEFDQMVGQRV